MVQKANNNWRFLIVDNYFSYVNMQFINLYDIYCIILIILLLHSTHRLQFFDIRIFLLLVIIYSKQIDLIIQSNHGFIKIIKCNF